MSLPGVTIALTPVADPGLDVVPAAGGTLTTAPGGGVLVVLGAPGSAAPPAGTAVMLAGPAGVRTWTVRSVAPATAAEAATLAAAAPASGLRLLLPVAPGAWRVVVAG